MGWFAHLFQRRRDGHATNDVLDHAIQSEQATAIGSSLSGSPGDGTDTTAEAHRQAVEIALAPIRLELQRINDHFSAAFSDVSDHLESLTQTRPDAGVPYDRESLERAIEAALAHFYYLLRGREEFRVPAVTLKPTSDGNTALPLDPQLQHFLIVMHPLYPHLYTTMIVLPGTFTHVDPLQRLPNGVQALALHINAKKAPPGFMDALLTLHRSNWENLFLGTLTPSSDEHSSQTLQYFRCTGSPIRNPMPERFPDDEMIYFNRNPEPFILRQKPEGAEDVFAALANLEQSAAARDAETQEDSNEHGSDAHGHRLETS